MLFGNYGKPHRLHAQYDRYIKKGTDKSASQTIGGLSADHRRYFRSQGGALRDA